MLKSEIERYIEEFGEVPSLKDIETKSDYPNRQDFRNTYGSFSKAIEEMGYVTKFKINYTDDELEKAFMSFVNEYGRVPSIYEFNNSKYPSFWTYQNRFGSWTKAVLAYGFEPYTYKTLDGLKESIIKLCNDMKKNTDRRIITYSDINDCKYCASAQTYNIKFKRNGESFREFLHNLGFTLQRASAGMLYEFEDGEIALSQHEYKISKYLRDNKIKYHREIKYKYFINNYNGNKDCDYVIYKNDEIYYIEMAGMVSKDEEKDNGKVQELYRIHLKEKIEMLESAKLNYKIIYPEDMRQYSLDEIFSFLYN